MSTRETIDLPTRLRIAAHLRELKWRNRFKSDAEMAREIGVSRGALNRALKGEKNVGLDFLLAVHRSLKVSLDWLCDRPPDDARFTDPDFSPPLPKPVPPSRD